MTMLCMARSMYRNGTITTDEYNTVIRLAAENVNDAEEYLRRLVKYVG